MLSDAASKPLFIAGREDWPRLARQMAVGDVLRVGADGRLQVTRSFAARLKFEPGVPVPEIIE
jgi:thiamine biosynthesis lipoprotein